MNRSLQIGSMDELSRFSAMIAKAGYFGVSPEQAAIKILAGLELGIGPLQALMNVHVIKDGRGSSRVTLAAGLVGALIKASTKYEYRVLDTTTKQCVLEFYDETRPIASKKIGTASFTIEEARLAGLLDKHNWKTYPSDMLFARALTRGARRFCPDIFGGPIYTPDEISGDEYGAPDLEVSIDEAPDLGKSENDDLDHDAVRDGLLSDLVKLAAGEFVPWLTHEIATDPIGGNSWFGQGVLWMDGALDEKENKAVRQRFHIWVKEAENAYDDVRHWPLYAIKARGVINYNRALRRKAAEDAKAKSDEEGDARAPASGEDAPAETESPAVKSRRGSDGGSE